MNTKIAERKNIIVSLKPNYTTNKGINKKIQFLELMFVLNLVLTFVCGGVLIFSILSELFNYEFYQWQKTGLLAILSLSIVMKLPNELYELKLLRHLKKINSKSEFDGIDKLNNELKSIIENLNNRLKRNWDVIILAIVILLMGIWQIGFDTYNPYWNYMKLPIVAFFGIIIFRFIFTYRKLTKNINETEKYCC